MQSTRGTDTATPQALPSAKFSHPQPSQGHESTQTIEITGVLNRVHTFGANDNLGPKNRYWSRGPA
jgi:hypothetical protein